MSSKLAECAGLNSPSCAKSFAVSPVTIIETVLLAVKKLQLNANEAMPMPEARFGLFGLNLRVNRSILAVSALKPPWCLIS